MARLAARELLSHDFKSYAVIGWPRPVYWAEDKIGAFRAALALHGRSAQVFRPRPGEQHDITALQRRLRAWMDRLPRPCGIFGVNDLICEIALSAATSLGNAIPEDFAFVGADNDPLICETTIPSLTSVQPNFHRTGFIAAELLAERMSNPLLPARLCVVPPLQLVRRLSTRWIHRQDDQVKKTLARIAREAANGITARGALADFPCSRRQAEIRFRAATGHSVLAEIQNVRFAQAMELLRNPSIALGAIADRTGWPSPLVLSRFVRRRTGKTLSQLRRELCSGESERGAFSG
ncbi:MAG: substrate-binding domain-containing protein [Kiritimatiellia bacterium]